MWQGKVGGGLPLESTGANSVERGKKGGKKKNKRKRKKRGVRGSTFSLEFTEIGPVVSIGERGKVHPRDESFM